MGKSSSPSRGISKPWGPKILWPMAILSRQVVKEEVLKKSLRELPFTDAEIAYRFYLIYRQDKYFSRALKAFMDTSMELSSKLSST